MRTFFRTAFLFFLTLLAAQGEEHWFRSEGGGCLVETHDPVLSDDLVALTARLQAGAALPAPAPGGARLLIRVENGGPADPLFLRRGKDWQVTLFAAPGANGISGTWLRPVLAGLLMRGGTQPPPFWLTEGAFQTVAGQQGLLAQIVRRAAGAGTAPSLAEVLSWKEPGAPPLFAAWRQAFAWQARLFFLAEPDRAVFLTQWERPADPALEKTWRQFIQNGPPPAPLASWEEASAALQKERETGLLLPAQESKPERKFSWDDLPQARDDARFPAEAARKIARLEVLEMRAPFAWRPVIALYRDALASLRADAAHFPARLAAARKADAQLADLTRQTDDYLNWYEVTRAPVDWQNSPFSGYFKLATEFDAAFSGSGRVP